MSTTTTGKNWTIVYLNPIIRALDKPDLSAGAGWMEQKLAIEARIYNEIQELKREVWFLRTAYWILLIVIVLVSCMAWHK